MEIMTNFNLYLRLVIFSSFLQKILEVSWDFPFKQTTDIYKDCRKRKTGLHFTAILCSTSFTGYTFLGLAVWDGRIWVSQAKLLYIYKTSLPHPQNILGISTIYPNTVHIISKWYPGDVRIQHKMNILWISHGRTFGYPQDIIWMIFGWWWISHGYLQISYFSQKVTCAHRHNC